MLESMTYNLKVGQIVTTEARQIVMPEEYEIYTQENGQWQWKTVGDGQLAIRIHSGANPCISTNIYRHSGLVCFLPPWTKNCAILSVRITKLHTKSVEAEPVEYIELQPEPTQNLTGEDANDIFNSYLEQLEAKAIWHNKAERIKETHTV